MSHRRPRVIPLDAPPAVPAWIRQVEEALLGLNIHIRQRLAAIQLLDWLERDPRPFPFIDRVDRNGEWLARLSWVPPNGRRSVVAVPMRRISLSSGSLKYSSRLYVEIAVRDEKGEVWAGIPAEPVPMARGMLGWVFAVGEDQRT